MRHATITTVLAVLPALVVVPTAAADTPGCVSKHEYARVAKGMTMTQVHRIFDTEGNEIGLGEPPNRIRYYRPCRVAGQVEVVFNAVDRVVRKGSMLYS